MKSNSIRSVRSQRPLPASRDRVAVRRRPQRSSGCGVLFLGFVMALILAVIVVVFLFNRFNQATEQIVEQDPRQRQEAPAAGTQPDVTPIRIVDSETLEEPFNVLLLGVDKREQLEEGVRGDTLIVVHIDPEEGWVSMLSIPRDTVAHIPNVGTDKINAAYQYGFTNAEMLYGSDTSPEAGGGALAAETVENFLGIDVDYIAQVDFQGFEELVDMLGGLTVNVTRPILDAEYPTENYGFERIYIPAGLQVLDGRTALRYARSRHSGTDFERSQRQQQVLQAFLRSLQERGILQQIDILPSLIEHVENNISTTMPINDPAVIYGLAQLAQKIDPGESMVRLSINPNDVAVVYEAGSDIYWDPEGIAQQVDKFLQGPVEPEETARVQVLNGTGVSGLAARFTNMLSIQDFEMARAADAPTRYDHTTIVDFTGLPGLRQRLADVMDIDEEHVYEDPMDMDVSLPPPDNADIVVILGKDYKQHQILQ